MLPAHIGEVVVSIAARQLSGTLSKEVFSYWSYIVRHLRVVLRSVMLSGADTSSAAATNGNLAAMLHIG